MTALMFLSFFGVTALFVFVLAAACVRRYPPVGAGLACASLIPLWEMPYPPAIFQYSGLNIYPADGVTLVLLVVGLLEWTQLRANLRGWTLVWLFFGVIIAISLLNGILVFGLGTAVNEARPLLYFFFAMTWALAVRPDRLRLHDVSMVVGWGLVLVALYHGVMHGVGGPSSWVSVDDGGRQTGRVLVAPQGAALLLCGASVLLGLSASRKARRQFSAVSSLVFLGVVVFAQHRSVWAAGALGMAVLLIWVSRSETRNRVVVLTGIIAWLVLLTWSIGFLDGIGSEFVDSVSDTRTYNWRTSSWKVLISEAIAIGPTTVLGGEPFGSGYLRQLDTGAWTSVSAHSWYVTVFLRLGMIGLITILAILTVALVKSRANGAVWTFIIVAVSVYGWSYSVDWYLAPWLGAAITMSLGSGWTAQHCLSGTAPEKNPFAGQAPSHRAVEILQP